MERLFGFTFRGMWKRPTLKVFGNRLTLPRGFDTARGADPCDGSPMPIYSEFHKFAAYGGRYAVSDCCSCQYGLTLISESAQTFLEPTDVTYTIRAVATEAVTGGLIFTGGFDENEEEILTSVALDLVNGSADTTQQYTQLPDILKLVTTDPVSLYYVDVDTGDATLMAVYAPGETTPSYRQYQVSGLDDGDLVRVLCKLGFEPAITSTDLIVPGLLGALKLGLQALRFEDKVDPVNAGIYWGPNYPDRNPGKMSGAIDLLDKEIAELGAAERVVFQVSPDFGSGSIVNVM